MSTIYIENKDTLYTSDKSNTTTDDEFFNELMKVPPEFENHLIPDECDDEVKGIEHLIKCLDYRFNSYPVICIGTLRQAVQEAFIAKNANDRRPLLIYVNHDKGIYSNIFCKQFLCNENVIEYLMNNYVLWAWDVTFKSNEQKLTHTCQTVFPSWTNEKQFNTDCFEQYPLLIGVYRSINGNFTFDRLIEGLNKKLNIDEFLSSLIEFKDKFVSNEEKYETAKEEAKQQLLQNVFLNRNSYNQLKRSQNREYLRSLSMHATGEHDEESSKRQAQFSRLLSTDMNMRLNSHEMFLHHTPMKEQIMHGFERFDRDSDADDEDDERTPTVDRPVPKFP